MTDYPPIVDTTLPIEKRAAQSGFKMSAWSYVAIPDFPSEWKSPKGMAKVRGFVDAYPIQQHNLLPMQHGYMMLPLKAAIRKAVGKEAGDTVRVVLFPDTTPLIIPDYLMVCLLDAPDAHRFFTTLSESNQKYYIDWIEGTKNPTTQIARISKTIERLEQGMRFYDWAK